METAGRSSAENGARSPAGDTPVRPSNLIKVALPPAVLYSSENPRYINFAEMGDGTLLELVEDPHDPTQSRLAVCKCGRCVVGLGAREEGLELLPVPRYEGLLRHVRLPRGVKPYASLKKLLAEIEGLMKLCVVVPEERYVRLLGLFVLNTWVADRLPVAPYLSIVGLPESGKTTLLQVLALVCRRALLTGDISVSTLLDACANLGCTVLIDEADSQGSALHRVLRMGSTPGLISVGKGPGSHAFGAKVMCFRELSADAALNSRCVTIPMREANSANLARPSEPTVQALADDLQQQLLKFRFDNLSRVRPRSVPIASGLRPRAHDLFQGFAGVASEDENLESLRLAVLHQDVALRDPLTPAQTAVLGGCFSVVHRNSPMATRGFKSLQVSYLTKVVNDELERSGERFYLEARKVGAVLTTLGFVKRERTSRGWVVWFEKDDIERLHELMQLYGEDVVHDAEVHLAMSRCPQCMQRGIVNAAGVKWE